MSYHPAHDSYYSTPIAQSPDGYHINDTGVVSGYPASGYSSPRQPYTDYESHYDGKSIKSYQSSHAGSQAHLSPQYEMSQAKIHNPPPVPAMPYNMQQPNYPPMRYLNLPLSPQNTGYSVAREKLMKRRSVRHVELQQGNLVLDVHVPSHIVPQGDDASEEMTKMRYTAATCDPDDFMRQKYTLRPYLSSRQTELFIVMTMYNEDEVLFIRTMNS